MIYDQPTNTVFGNLGWVDHGALWVYSVATGVEKRVAVEGAASLGVKPGLDGVFGLVHHQSDCVAASIRPYENPERELATLYFSENRPILSGDLDLWQKVDPVFIVNTKSAQRLIRIDTLSGDVVDLDLSWFIHENYDPLYQALVDCVFLPDLGLVAVAVQRSSELVLIDIDRNQRVRKITLSNRHGNPALRRRSASEFAASDYDCLCLVDAASGAVASSKPLQEPQQPFVRQFIGGYALAAASCVVARPFSSDVLVLDLPSFDVRQSVPTGGQPLAVCLTSPSSFLTRDWKTGTARLGELWV